MFDAYTWEEIYPIWKQYLHCHCGTPEEVINFVNLYVYYEAGDKPISDPIDFISYLYYRVDMDQYWDKAGELFEGLAINILTRAKLINIITDPYYSPLKDERILNGIERWKEKRESEKNQ